MSQDQAFSERLSSVSLPTGGTNLQRYRRLFANRNFRYWFGSALTSSLGDWAGLFALQALVASLSADQSRIQLFSLGAIMMARTLPSLLFGPLAGVLADRYDRKRLMVSTDLVRAAIFVVIAFTGDLVALFALTFIVETTSLIFASAKDATLGALVDRDDLTEANQLNLIVTYGTLPLGGLMGLVLAALSSLLRGTGLEATSLVLLLNAVTFLVSAVFMGRLAMPAARRRRHREAEAPGLVAELREGLTTIRSMPVVRALIFGVMGIFFGGGVIFALGPALLEDNNRWFTVVTLVGVGLVLGMALSSVVASRFPKERIMGIGMTVMAGLACAIALTSDFRTISILAFGLGVSAGLAFVLGYTLLHEQTYADDEVRGTTFATFYTGTRAAMFLALGVAPLVAGAIGRFGISFASYALDLSGLRITILAGGLVALAAAFTTMRALWGRVGNGDDQAYGAIAPRARGGGRGLFIAFEGVEGSGKSTQLVALANALRDEGHEVVTTREPGGSAVGERIRAVLLDPECSEMSLRTEALLYSAARAQLVESVIQPALDDGKIVLSDRFVDSSLAYQGFARRLGHREVAEINSWATEGLRPDVVVWLRLDPGSGLDRVDKRRSNGNGADGEGRDRLEREPDAFHQDVAGAYEQLARTSHRRWITVDASQDTDLVAAHIRRELERWLPVRSSA
jgi:dTMP kinase